MKRVCFESAFVLQEKEEREALREAQRVREDLELTDSVPLPAFEVHEHPGDRTHYADALALAQFLRYAELHLLCRMWGPRLLMPPCTVAPPPCDSTYQQPLELNVQIRGDVTAADLVHDLESQNPTGVAADILLRFMSLLLSDDNTEPDEDYMGDSYDVCGVLKQALVMGDAQCRKVFMYFLRSFDRGNLPPFSFWHPNSN